MCVCVCVCVCVCEDTNRLLAYNKEQDYKIDVAKW